MFPRQFPKLPPQQRPATSTSPDGQPYNLSVAVDGGEPGSSDALVVADTGGATLPATDFAVVIQSRHADEGRVRVFRSAVAMPDITYTDVEVISPIVAPNSDPNTDDTQLLVLGPDNYEQNESRSTSAYLGSGDVINVTDLAISPNATEHRFVPADQDYFRVVAEVTGTLDVQL